MNYRDAAAYRLSFGKYAGQTIDQVGSTDAGLLYLDWIRGDRGQQTVSTFDDALCTYLDNATIAADLAKLARGSR